MSQCSAGKKLEVGEFAHNIKHHLMVMQEMLRAAHSGDPEIKEQALFRLEKNIQRVLRETDAVLLAEKDDVGMLKFATLPISLSELAQEGVTEFSRLFEAGRITVHADFASTPSTPIDPALFPHVINNLLDNALKYSKPGGTVELRTRGDQKTVILEVENSGNLCSANDLTHLFERHFRANNASMIPGNGLGLYLVKRIVEGHGGEVHAELSDHNSMKVVVTLPAEPDGKQ